MIPSILSKQLKQGVSDFLKTTFPVSTPFFHGIVERLLDEADAGISWRKRIMSSMRSLLLRLYLD